jgi:hypothetical protein
MIHEPSQILEKLTLTLVMFNLFTGTEISHSVFYAPLKSLSTVGTY